MRLPRNVLAGTRRSEHISGMDLNKILPQMVVTSNQEKFDSIRQVARTKHFLRHTTKIFDDDGYLTRAGDFPGTISFVWSDLIFMYTNRKVFFCQGEGVVFSDTVSNLWFTWPSIKHTH